MISPGGAGIPSDPATTEAFVNTAVSPCVKPNKRLEPEVKDDGDWFETVHGEGFPKDIAQRDAETARVDDSMEQDREEEEEQPETEGVNARRSPKEPTELERLRHEATHVPYRSWCQHCVRGHGRRKPHYRKAEGDSEGTVPKISMAYFFLRGAGWETVARTQRKNR